MITPILTSAPHTPPEGHTHVATFRSGQFGDVQMWVPNGVRSFWRVLPYAVNGALWWKRTLPGFRQFGHIPNRDISYVAWWPLAGIYGMPGKLRRLWVVVRHAGVRKALSRTESPDVWDPVERLAARDAAQWTSELAKFDTGRLL